MLSFLLAAIALWGACDAQTRCCLPPQWESPVNILEGYYVPTTDSVGTVEDRDSTQFQSKSIPFQGRIRVQGVDKISFDYVNKRISSSINGMKSNGHSIGRIKSVTDFSTKRQYVDINGNCSWSDLVGEEFLQNWECIPESANFSGTTYYGAGNNRLYFDIWQFLINGLNVFMTVTQTGCLPLTESVTGTFNSEGITGVVLLSYTGLTTGIKNTSVFDPPSPCAYSGKTVNVGTGTAGSIVGRMKRRLVDM